MTKRILVLAAALLLTAGSIFAASSAPRAKGKAIDFTLNDLHNNQVSLSDFKGKPLALFFWTTWCPYCREELKNLNTKYETLIKNGLQILPIDAGEPSQRVANYLKNKGYSLRVFLDEDGSVTQSYDVMGVPTYIFIDEKGEIVFRGNSFPPEFKKYF